MRRTRIGARVLAAAGMLAATLVAGPALATPASAATTVNGTGSTFAAPELQQWAGDVQHAPYNLTINYQVSSSGAGRQQYAAGLVDFGASDIPYNAEDGNLQQQAQTQHPFKYVTVSAGGLAFQYNLVIGGQEFQGLNLTPTDVCGIFTGEITNWSQLASGQYATTGDQILAAYNSPIIPIVRSDSAGESYVLSQYCQAVEPGEWTTFQNWVDQNATSISYSDPNMANGLPVSQWPGVLYGGDHSVQSDSGATAAAQSVKNPGNDGAITYVANSYAKVENSPVASVENAAGYFVQPTPNNVQLALSYASANSIGTFNLNFTGGNPNAYFPSTYSYVLDPTGTSSQGINGPLNQFLCYSIGKGQQEAGALLYAPLSAEVTALSVAAIEATPDAPAASGCGVGGPAPVVSANGGGISGNSGGSGTSTGHAARPPVHSSTPPTTAAGTGGSGSGGGGTSGTGTGTGTGTGGSSAPTTAAGSAPVSGSGGGTTSSGSGPATGSGSGSTTCGSTTSTTGPSKHRRHRGAATTTTTACAPTTTTLGAAGTGGTASGATGPTTPAAPPVQAVQTAAGSSSPPIGNQALWWVLGGAALAAGVSWLVGLTRRPS